MTDFMLPITQADIDHEAAYERYYERGYRDGLWDANLNKHHKCPKWPGYEHGYLDAYITVMRHKLNKAIKEQR